MVVNKKQVPYLSLIVDGKLLGKPLYYDTPYKVLSVESGAARGYVNVGDTVYIAEGYDYGVAKDDTIATRIPHVTVTNRSGKDPDFTMAVDDLEELL